MKQLYQELIIDHNKSPRNFREMDDSDYESKGHNPLCGDKLQLYVKIDSENIITDVSFTGDGCAISKASASMMTTAVKGKTIAEARTLFHQFHDMSTGKLDIAEHPHQLGKLAIFAGVRDLPARVKCATLAWHTLDAALKGKEIITTE
ncbi:MAG: SUF system NifU family Fe-S cluster assembly protein [Balneolales bacterium]|nr:SUF system NifU family Fe-S cluster assembly protein [Balneolales bacterium]